LIDTVGTAGATHRLLNPRLDVSREVAELAGLNRRIRDGEDLPVQSDAVAQALIDHALQASAPVESQTPAESAGGDSSERHGASSLVHVAGVFESPTATQL